MKKMKWIGWIMVVLVFAACGQKPEKSTANGELKGRLSISGAFALYPLTVRWAEEFKKVHPNVRIDISAGGAGKGMTDVLNGMVEIGMVSRAVQPVEKEKGAWPLPVAKDAVLPMMNAQNPLLPQIKTKGVRASKLADIWLVEKKTSWEEVLGMPKTKESHPIHVYTRSDSCGAADTWAVLFGKKQENLIGIGVYGDPGLAEAVKNDALGIGFNNVNYAYDAATHKVISGLEVLSVDWNENGTLDAEENFFDTRESLIQAIIEGKYPSPPARELYFVFRGKPELPLLKIFMKWIFTDGQKFVEEAGYIAPSAESIQQSLQKIGN